MINTVLGQIQEDALGITLPHEHICCYSEYAYQMAGSSYLDKHTLASLSTAYLKELKEKHHVATLIDCTPINIGRDLELLKRVSEGSGVNIVCATGFYYTDEPVLYNTPVEQLCQYIVADARTVHAGIIKCAVEAPTISAFQEKLLRASAKAHLHTGLPIVLHSNANNRNAQRALEILFAEKVAPQAITVGHLSDTEDLDYIRKIASYGCYIGLDRLYENTHADYIAAKLHSISALCQAGYEDQLLLSHDAQFFNGFESAPEIIQRPRLSYCFDHILPQLPQALRHKLMVQNPRRTFAC